MRPRQSPARTESLSVLGLYLTAAVYGLTFWYHPANDVDLGWHLLGGAWVSSHHAVPTSDFINSFNPFWHDYHWLGQVILYQLYGLGGYELLRFSLGILVAYIGKLLVDIILLASRRRPSMIVLLAGFFGSITLISEITSVRPQMISVAVIALAARRLMQKPTPWELPYLLLLTILLVNVHVYWVFMPTLWFIYRCVPRFTRKRAPSIVHAWGGLMLLSLCGFVSPYGIIPFGKPPPFVLMNYALLWDYLTMPGNLSGTIREFRGSLAIPGATSWIVLAWIVLISGVFRWRRFVGDLSSGLAALLGGALAVRAVKFVPVLAVLGLPFFVRHVSRFVSVRLPAVAKWTERPAQIVLVLVLLGSLWHAGRHFPWIHDTADALHYTQPIDACRHIATLDLVPSASRGHIRVLTHFNHGGWCRWVLHQERPELDYRVTTDGRTQGVPVKHFLDAYNVYGVTRQWFQTLTRWDPDVLLIPKSEALVYVLAMDPVRYTLTYQDDRFAVYVPVRPAEN